MGEILSSFVADLLARAEGPLHLRLLFQPLMAVFFAVRDGRKDALAGRPAYGWALVTDPEHRAFLLRDGWKSIVKVFVVAYALDVTYQFVAVGQLRPLQAVTVAFVLAIVPYVLLRGPTNRLMPGKSGSGSAP